MLASTKACSHHRPLATWTLLAAILLPAMGCAEDENGSAEKMGEKVDETASELRDSAARGIDAAGEAVKKTGEVVEKRAQEAADAVSGKSEK